MKFVVIADMKRLPVFFLLFCVLACTNGPPPAEYSLTTAELERYYLTNRMEADNVYTRHNLKITGIVGTIDPIDNGSLLTFKSTTGIEVLCRFDKPNDAKLALFKPDTRIAVNAWNAGIEKSYIKLFNCFVTD